MNPYKGNYIIDKIRNLSDGLTHELEGGLKGKEVFIHRVKYEEPLLAYFGDVGLFTASIKEIEDYDDYLQVYTMNTLYQFKKVVG